jgi:DNA invertase Pin-like site-specific DNA recombinase
VRRLASSPTSRSAGWTLPATYTDFAISGNTTEFEQMLKDAAQRRFDVLMVWSIDQLGRSLQDLVVTLAHLQSAASIFS